MVCQEASITLYHIIHTASTHVSLNLAIARLDSFATGRNGRYLRSASTKKTY
jgi:hypothetical protein